MIEDPDRERCLKELADIQSAGMELAESPLLTSIPNYRDLFFGTVDASRLIGFNNELESLVTEMANSRDRVELDMLNGFPVMPCHGVQAPFAKEWANRTVGIVFPIGLLFVLRAWLFSRKLQRQMIKATQVASNLIDYMNNKHI